MEGLLLEQVDRVVVEVSVPDFSAVLHRALMHNRSHENLVGPLVLHPP